MINFALNGVGHTTCVAFLEEIAVWYRVADRHRILPSATSDHLAGQKYLLEVERYAKTLAQIRTAVKFHRISAVEIQRHYIALMLSGLGDKRFLPAKVAYYLAGLSDEINLPVARTYTGRK